MQLLKRNVDDFQIGYILREFIKPIKTNIIIHFEITNKGVVNLYSNRPGILIGSCGNNISLIKHRLQKECNAKDVKIFEMRNLVSNCGIY